MRCKLDPVRNGVLLAILHRDLHTQRSCTLIQLTTAHVLDNQNIFFNELNITNYIKNYHKARFG